MAGSKAIYSKWENNQLVFRTAAGVEVFRQPWTSQTRRFRVATSDVNAGLTLLAALAVFKYRLLDAFAIAIGGAAGAVTTVDILGTQATASAKLVAFGQANLTQSTIVRAGGTGGTVLADGASFAVCDVNTAITIGKTGASLTTATFVDVFLTYAIEV